MIFKLNQTFLLIVIYILAIFNSGVEGLFSFSVSNIAKTFINNVLNKNCAYGGRYINCCFPIPLENTSDVKDRKLILSFN